MKVCKIKELMSAMVTTGVVVAAFAVTGISDKDIQAKNILVKVQSSILEAKTLRVVMRESMNGINVETRAISKKMSNNVFSFRQEMHVLGKDKSIQPFIQIMDRNKLYNFPTGCGDVVIRMKFMEKMATGGHWAKLFLPDGKIEMLKPEKSVYSIRYICTAGETKILGEEMRKLQGKMFNKELIPAIFEYKISKDTLVLNEVLTYSARGRLVKRQIFDDWKFNCDVADSNFQIPNKYKVYTARTMEEGERINVELLKKAMMMRRSGK